MSGNGLDYGALLDGALAGDGPLFRLLAGGIREAIDRGDIPMGSTLPPERGLASILSLSRTTVAAAYALLKTQGWLESRQGSGTWVRRPEQSEGAFDAVATRPLMLAGDGTDAAMQPAADTDLVELSVAALAPSPLVLQLIGSCAPDELAAVARGHGYVPAGSSRLRAQVAESLTGAGLATTPAQLVVTNGAHQAISLVVRQILRPGDSVLVESPTYPGVLDILRRFEAHPIPVPVDEDGARVELVPDLLVRTDAKLLYLTPHFHSPTGSVMSASRRQQVAELADRTGLAVIEDLAMADILIDDQSTPPPVASYARGDTVHAVGSLSKLFWAGLRVGWVRSPDSWHARMLSTKTVADMGTSPITQLLGGKLLRNRDAVLRERRQQLRQRRDLMCGLLAEQLPSWTWQRPTGGLSIWAQLPAGNADEFAEVALRHGVAVVPGPSLSVDSGNRRYVRLSYAAEPEAIALGVPRLAEAWQAYVTRASGSARLLV